MPSFLTLVKEEPSSEAAMEVVVSRPMPLQAHPTSISDSQMQNLAQMTANIQARGPLRGEIEPNFEPVSRLRSNTWPLPCPENYIEKDDAPSLTETTSSGEPNRGPGALPSFAENPGGPPKKNTSRRNPWGNMSYADLIAQAIISTSEGRATLSQIYDWMVQSVPYFKDKGDSNSSAGWKNSIRHNLSLHSRFMRMQNEGTGKSSWWVLNPEAKPGKSTRRRANTLEGGAARHDKKRGRVRKKNETNAVMRNGVENPVSPNMGDLDYYPSSPPGGAHHPSFQLSPQDYRPRASSNASSCGGRLTPIPANEADMHDAQVPPMSPGLNAWGPEYWSASNHNAVHGPPSAHAMGRLPHHEHYADQLAETMGEQFTLGGNRESWASHHVAMNPSGPHQAAPHNLHHMNGFVNQHPSHPGFGSYEDFSRFGAHGPSHGPKFFQHAPMCDKTNTPRPLHPFQIAPLQNVSPAHSLSPPNGVVDFTASNCEGDLRSNPSYASPHHNHPQSTPTTPQSHSQGVMPSVPTHSPLSLPGMAGHHMDHSPPMEQEPRAESTAMLRVALSHKDASSCIHNGPQRSGATGPGSSDLPDLDNFQGGLECNVEEVIKHELQYEDHLNFDFHGHSAAAAAAAYAHHGHSFASAHRDSGASQLAGNTAPSSVYSCPPIQAGNQWVR